MALKAGRDGLGHPWHISRTPLGCVSEVTRVTADTHTLPHVCHTACQLCDVLVGGPGADGASLCRVLRRAVAVAGRPGGRQAAAGPRPDPQRRLRLQQAGPEGRWAARTLGQPRSGPQTCHSSCWTPEIQKDCHTNPGNCPLPSVPIYLSL